MQKTLITEQSAYKPLFFSCNSSTEMDSFAKLASLENFALVNRFENQLLDIAECTFPKEKLMGMDSNELISKWLDGRDPNTLGNWVYFPWKKTATKILSERDFVLCRTNRNKLKISAVDQDVLGKKSVLFVGLSVGQSAALTCAMQRLGGTLHLADFDTLSLSNMNRLRASVLDIDTPKCIIAARQIAEQDPYINVVCHPDGVTNENIENLLTQNNTVNVDIVVEECDSLEMKFLIREKAKKYRIPVIMETSDKGVVDIERFDMDNSILPFHGLVGEMTYEKVNLLSHEEKFGLLSKIVDINRISEGLRKSYAALGTEVITWPQLGYEVTLGGATLTYAACKILLGQSMKSGRIYVDLDSVFENNI